MSPIYKKYSPIRQVSIIYKATNGTVCILMSLDKYVISTYVLPLLITLGYWLKSKFMMTF